MIHYTALPKVLHPERVTGEVEAGATLDEIVGRVVVDHEIHPLMIPALAVFVIDPATGAESRIPYERWRKVRPKPGCRVAIKALPQGGGGGGGGKSPIKTVAVLAVMVAAAAVTYGMSAYLGAGVVGVQGAAGTWAATSAGLTFSGTLVAGMAGAAVTFTGPAVPLEG